MSWFLFRSHRYYSITVFMRIIHKRHLGITKNNMNTSMNVNLKRSAVQLLLLHTSTRYSSVAEEIISEARTSRWRGSLWPLSLPEVFRFRRAVRQHFGRESTVAILELLILLYCRPTVDRTRGEPVIVAC